MRIGTTIIVAFVLGVLVGVGGLLVLQHPRSPAVLIAYFRNGKTELPRIVEPVGCDPAWFCEEHKSRR